MNNKKNSKSKFFKGFSFVEVMLSVFLVSVGITAALSLILSGIKNSSESRRQFVATLLSQEGVELVRNIRDTNAKDNPSESFSGINKGSLIIDYENDSLRVGSGKLKQSDGFYEHGGSGENSQFSRKIYIESPDVDDKRIIYSTVVWGKGEMPSGKPTENNCNPAKHCVFVMITLNKWRE